MVAVLPFAMRTALAWILAAAPVAAGCFYGDPINERPSADIERTTEGPIARGDLLEVYAQVYDPDGDVTQPSWTATACTAGGDCEPVTTGTSIEFEFEVPLRVAGAATTRVRVELDVTDAWGARTAPRQTLDVDVSNAEPTLEPLQDRGRMFMGAYPLDVPVTVVARKADLDDGAAAVEVIATPFAPTGATLGDATFDPVGVVSEDGAVVSWELTAHVRGQWELLVEADDRNAPDTVVSRSITIPFEDDQAPCVGPAEPSFPPTGARIIVDQTRRFAVLSVEDDLDIFPFPSPDHDFLGFATFRWFLASPATGGAITPLAVDGNSVDLDPSTYAPGDQLELRVEVSDRENRPLCDGLLATCEAVAGCFQRRTWSLEVR